MPELMYVSYNLKHGIFVGDVADSWRSSVTTMTFQHVRPSGITSRFSNLLIVRLATSPPKQLVVGEYAEYATSKETPRSSDPGKEECIIQDGN